MKKIILLEKLQNNFRRAPLATTYKLFKFRSHYELT